jgi:hypothetical protein
MINLSTSDFKLLVIWIIEGTKKVYAESYKC